MSRSNFPEKVDEFIELFDLPYDKVISAERLTMLKCQEKLTNDEQNELMTLSAELEEYMITAETFNKFQDALQAVQQFFYSNVQGFIENKQKIWDSYIRQFHYVGKWNAGVKYKFQNMVIGTDGDLFICKKDHTATAQTNPLKSTELWQRVSSKGDKGDIGLNAFYKGDWSATATYDVGDAVSYMRDGWRTPLVYICKTKGNVGKKPDEHTTDWLIYTNLMVSDVRPRGAAAGVHYIKFD